MDSLVETHKIIENPTVYNGELLPWKGVWWKVSKQGIDDNGYLNVLLVQTSDKTSGAVKRELARKRRMK